MNLFILTATFASGTSRWFKENAETYVAVTYWVGVGGLGGVVDTAFASYLCGSNARPYVGKLEVTC